MDPELWQEIERLYHLVRELKQDEREVVLRRETAGDESLRREVESLLSRPPEGQDFLEAPALEVAAMALAKDRVNAPPIDLSGRSIAHYRVLEKIGEGGMGVVYKARDLHLGRFVALKVLPPEQVADPERKRRFVQEAKAASALNHPNIVHVYDIDQSEGTDYIAMEYVDGKTLDQRIGHRGLRLNDALKYAVQIADALSKAHSAGIVHRDLKPTNIMVNEDGAVKVLDFGLAKLTEQIQGDETVSPATVDSEGRPITEEGVILGTVAYMSPEQAEGKKVDARSDIFSFGSLLYEMVTGQKAFQSTSKMSTLSAILHDEPKPASGILPEVPSDLEKLINRCLRKDPTKRLQHMDDVKVALDDLKEESDSGALQAAGVIRPRPRYQLTSALAMVLLAIIVTLLVWYLYRQRADAVREPLRTVPFTSLPGMEGAPRFSPDGKFVAFQWNGPAKDNWDVYVKQISGGEPLRLTTDPAVDGGPVWSPDGSQIAFEHWSGELASIYAVQSLGGGERKLYESKANLFRGGLSWSPDGRWLAFSESSAVDSPARICLLPLDTRKKIPLTSPPPTSTPKGDFTPEFSPDGKRIAFVRRMSWVSSDIWVQPVPSGEGTRLTIENYESISRPAWTSDGREIVFAARFALFRVPITGGVPQAIAGVGENAGAPTIWRNRMVLAQSLTNQARICRMRGPNYRGKDRSAAPLLVSTRRDECPDYSPDGKKLAFLSNRSGFYEIWICNSDGSRPVQLTDLRKASGPPRWSPDGRRIAFGCRLEEYEGIHVVDADGGIPRRLTSEKAQGENPSWSRDGRWIYFPSNRSGTFQVWKVPSEGGEAVQITKRGGHYAVESFDGKMLYYLKDSQRGDEVGAIWKVPCEGGEETPVINRAISFFDWALRPEGIYFSTWNEKKYAIEVLSFETGKITPFYQEEAPKLRFFLTVSHDGEWFLYDENTTPAESDLMLVENFR